MKDKPTDKSPFMHVGGLSSEHVVEDITKRNTQYFISGFEVHDFIPHSAVEDRENGLPLYRRRKESDGGAIYAAGHYCVKYSDGWKHGNSFTKTTIDRYEYIGPYHTEGKAKLELSKIKAALKPKDDK